MKKFILLLFVLYFSCLTSFGQDKFSSKSDEFIEQVQKMMASSKNEKLIAIGDELGLVFSDLTSSQREQIIALSNSFKEKRQKTPVFGYYYGGIVAATNSGDVTPEHLTQFLTVCKKTFEKDGVSQFNAFIKSASKFLIDLNIYKSQYYAYQIEGGTFSFEYAEEKVEETILDKYNEQQTEEEEDPFNSFEEDEGGDDEWIVDDDEGWGEIEEEEEVKETTEEKEEDVTDKMDYGYQAPTQPPVTGPVIKVENTNITIDAPGDSGIIIENTSGQYMLLKNQFVGTGGKFDWSNTGESEIEAFAELGGYNFKTDGKVLIKSEGAKLNFPAATDQQVEGAFEYRSTKKSPNYPAKYPRFISYKSQVELKNIGEGIQYFGGLSLEGSKQSSLSVYGDVSTIIVTHDGKEKFRARAKVFEISESKIFSNRAYLLALVNEDSIINYSMSLNYDKEENILTFYKGPKLNSIGPFFDTHHNVEINAEKLEWNLNEDHINFSMVYASNMKSASVESIDFYTDGRFSRMQGISRFHPLTLLMHYAKKKKSREVYVSDFAKFSKQPENVLRAAMSKLSREGYVSYSPGTGKVVIKRKAELYSKARRKKTDWDQLLIFSRANKNNITYNLENSDLKIRGVKEVMLSVQQGVKAIPDSGIIILKGNRDLFFDGKVFSGQFQFTGKEYRFDYDSFFVDMSKIDSIRLKLEQTDSLGNEENVHTLGNKLVYSAGTLYIDRKNNKSHKKNYPEYPIFDATAGAYVYFDKDDILNHAYDTTIYFRIPPFVVDSLNENNPDNVSFNGTFYGGGIIEPFDEVLKVMPDYSFGFVHDIPEKGHDIYGGKGKLFNKLTLNKGGLRSNGEITYLTSTVKSPDFVFYLDSAITDTGSSATMAEGELDGVLFPVATVNNYSLNWKIEEDKMHITNNDSVIQMYNGKASLDGTLTATPTGAIGKGKALSGRAVAESPEMYFSKDFFKARHADFYVNTEDETDSIPTIKADSVFLDYNMVEQYAAFGPEEEGSASIEFPFMKYKTSISHGRWDMVENIVSMKRDEEEDIEYSYFYSTHEEQDSLNFNADSAICDLDESTLKIFGVPFIKVADSKIVPDSNKVYIEENADMQSFKNATIYIDTLNEYHTLDSGRIDIISRNSYKGNAQYQFVNAAEDTFHIVFNEFRAERYSQKKRDKRIYTMSDGYVFEEDSFFIAPRIQYYGDVELDARENFLYFKGFVKIDLKGGFLSDWFVLDGRINPSDVKIDLHDPKSSDGTPLLTGLHVADGDSAHLYSTFIALKEMQSDFDIMKASGVFGYNPYQNEFSITDERKENEESLAGNVLVLNDSTSEIRYEGAFNFINNIPKVFEIHAGGNGNGSIKTGEYSFNTLLTTYFKLPGIITQQMADVVYEATRGSYEANPGEMELSYRIAEIAGDNPAQLYTESGEYLPLFSVSSKFNRSLVFSDINLKWSDEFAAFYSPDSVGLSNIMKNDINALVDGFVEIKKTIEGDEVNIYLQPDSSNWYYINYFKNTVTLLSSDIAFNALVFEKSKIDKRTSNEQYAFGLSDFYAKENFIYHYKTDYQGQKLDTLNPETLTQLQAELISKIQDYIGGGSTKEMDEGYEEEEEDIFLDDDLDMGEESEEEEVEKEEDTEESLFEEEEESDLNLDEEEDDIEMEEEEEENPWSEADKKAEKKKKKKDKKKEEPAEEESLLEEEEDTFLEEEEEPLFEEEEAPKEKKKKEKKPKEEPIEVEEEDEEPLLEEEGDVEEDLGSDENDPWSEANKKIEKKKKKKDKKKEEESDELLDSLGDELDDLDE